jgi:hypothetical protein
VRTGVLLIALAFLVTPATASASDCTTGGKTLAVTSLVRVYEHDVDMVGQDFGEETVRLTENRYYACWLATGSRLRLDARCSRRDLDYSDFHTCDESARQIDVDGRYVAVGFDRDNSTFTARDVIVWARVGRHPRRRVVFTLPRATGTSDPMPVETWASHRGGVAFSMRGLAAPGPNQSAIGFIRPLPGHKARYRELDRGPNVKAASLQGHRRAHRITWRNGNRLKSAPWR